MSKGTVQQVMTRVRGSTPDSPMAVFLGDEPGTLNAVFAATVRTQRMIEQGHPDLIGVYDGTMDLVSVQRALTDHMVPLR